MVMQSVASELPLNSSAIDYEDALSREENEACAMMGGRSGSVKRSSNIERGDFGFRGMPGNLIREQAE
jgi:hypothetical protein